MRRSSDEGTTEPLAALAAVALVCAGLSLYATFLDVPPSVDEGHKVAARVLDTVYDETSESGVVRPARLRRAVPERGRWRVNVSIESATRGWHYGPAPPDSATTSSRRVSVRRDPGKVSPGRLRVVVW